jgi:hypothetical protein
MTPTIIAGNAVKQLKIKLNKPRTNAAVALPLVCGVDVCRVGF